MTVREEMVQRLIVSRTTLDQRAYAALLGEASGPEIFEALRRETAGPSLLSMNRPTVQEYARQLRRASRQLSRQSWALFWLVDVLDPTWAPRPSASLSDILKPKAQTRLHWIAKTLHSWGLHGLCDHGNAYADGGEPDGL